MTLCFLILNPPNKNFLELSLCAIHGSNIFSVSEAYCQTILVGKLMLRFQELRINIKAIISNSGGVTIASKAFMDTLLSYETNFLKFIKCSAR